MTSQRQASNKKDADYQLETGLISIRRTAKVVKGGRIFRFSAVVVVGDGESQVGLGIGHGLEVSVAIQKATKQAKQNMLAIDLTKTGTIQHPLTSKYGATKVYMRPAAEGTGIIAGGAMRLVLKHVGVKNVLAKIYGSQCPQNVAYATLEGLKSMYTMTSVLRKRGKLKTTAAESPEA